MRTQTRIYIYKIQLMQTPDKKDTPNGHFYVDGDSSDPDADLDDDA